MNLSPTLCLNMIVKNESRIIKRLFDSVLPIIDSYCICDTGSTDNTIQLIEDYFREKGKPGKIVQEPFKNFCHNRNFALQACIGLSDFVLLLDADMILETHNFDKKILNSAESFNILQGNDSFYYQNLRIIKNNGLYNYVGVTHEYIDTPPTNTTIHLSKKDIFIRDIGDGGSKSDKFERDIRLLLEGIKEEPNNGRYYFYLGNSYHDSGKYEEAISAYKKRIEIGGWQQEVWYSYYRIGLSYMKLNNISSALFYWLEAFDYFPNRIENIYEIVKYYRINSKHKLAYHFYKLAESRLNLKKDDWLFLHNDVYSYKLYFEYIIIAYYNNITNINDEFIHVMNLSTDININKITLSNLKFYNLSLIPLKIINFNNLYIFNKFLS